MIPYQHFISSPASIYIPQWGRLPWNLVSWGLEKLGLAQKTLEAGRLVVGRYVLVRNVEVGHSTTTFPAILMSI